MGCVAAISGVCAAPLLGRLLGPYRSFPTLSPGNGSIAMSTVPWCSKKWTTCFFSSSSRTRITSASVVVVPSSGCALIHAGLAGLIPNGSAWVDMSSRVLKASGDKDRIFG